MANNTHNPPRRYQTIIVAGERQVKLLLRREREREMKFDV